MGRLFKFGVASLASPFIFSYGFSFYHYQDTRYDPK